MKPGIFHNRPSGNWLTDNHDYLVDRPWVGGLTKSLFSSLNDFAVLQNNLLQTPDGYKLEVAVPGMSKKDLQLEVDNQVLIVQGRKQQEYKSGWFKKATEYRSTQIYKTFLLPEDADIAGIRAKCKDGLLNISIPRTKYDRNNKIIPVKFADQTKMSWRQKIARPIKALWTKVRNSMNRLKPVF